MSILKFWDLLLLVFYTLNDKFENVVLQINTLKK